jgi:GNAT superfamily N-acetyltransferase
MHDPVDYIAVTPELKERIQRDWQSNAGDWIYLGDDCCSIAAMVDGRPIGVISAKKRQLSEPVSMVHEAWIYILEVHDNYRRQGIGTTLVESVVDWASENGMDQVASVSQEIRTEALLLWMKLGFTFIRSDFKDGDQERYGFYVARRIR